MSLAVSVVDAPTFQAALADVRSDDNDTQFLICGHKDGNPNEIELRSTGTDTSAIADHVTDEEFLYIYGRYHSTVDMSMCVKFVYIQWIGDKVPYVKKGRFGVVSGNISEHFAAHHLSFEASSREDLATDKIVSQLNESAGTADKVIDKTTAASRQERGFTQTQLPQKDSRPAFKVASVSFKGPTVEVTPEVYTAVSNVRSNTEPEMWMVAGYRDGNPKGPLVMVASGNGDLTELTECFSPSEPMYGLFRVDYTNNDDIISAKFVYLSWVGSSVKPMTKAKVSTHKGTANEIFSPAHVTVFASELSEISLASIMQQIKQQSS